MGTPATGELRPLSDGWEARIRIDDEGTRKGFELIAFAKADKDGARERCTAMATMAVRLRKSGHVAETEKLLVMAANARTAKQWGAVVAAVDALCAGQTEPLPSQTSVTFGDLAGQWTEGKLHKLYPDHVAVKKTSTNDVGRLKKWILPTLEHVPMHLLTLANAQDVLRKLPATASASTRRHVAQLIVRVCNLAVYPCEIIAASPLPRGFLPKLGKRKALAYLYPEEDVKLLAAKGTDDEPGVPLVHRLFYGMLAREGLRSEEAQQLTWSDVDLKRGALRLDKNKTDDPRAWALDPGVRAALQAWKEMNPDDEPSDRIFRSLDFPYRLAEVFREHLQVAGVTRAELFERSKVRRPIRIHDLRGTFVTLSLANGKTEGWVTDRTGHQSSTQVAAYRRAARTAEELNLGALAPLHEAIPELRPVPQECPTPVASRPPSEHPATTIPEECASAEEAADAPRLLDPLIGVRIPAPEPITHRDFRCLVARCSKDPVFAGPLGAVVTDGLREGERDDLAALARDAELMTSAQSTAQSSVE